MFATPWTAACQASLSITNSQSLLKLMSIKSVMPFNHFILCQTFLLLLSIFPSIRVFSKESGLHIRWPKYWSFSFSVSPSNECSGLISFGMAWLNRLAFLPGLLCMVRNFLLMRVSLWCSGDLSPSLRGYCLVGARSVHPEHTTRQTSCCLLARPHPAANSSHSFALLAWLRGCAQVSCPVTLHSVTVVCGLQISVILSHF